MKRAFIIHGWNGSPDEGWRPWLKKKLQDKGFEVFVPTMPDSTNPKLEVWQTYLLGLVGKPTKDDVFVGHSLGCIAILRFIESLNEGDKVGGAVLIAGFGQDLKYFGYNHELTSFFDSPIDWAKIKEHCSKFVAIHSTNDPLVSLDNAQLFRESLNAEIILKDNMRHFSGDDGITELPVALESVVKIAS